VRRLELAGGRLARLNEYGSGPSSSMSDGVGPIRLWPGGIMVGRAVGDRDVGGILLPNPNIRQVGRSASQWQAGQAGQDSSSASGCESTLKADSHSHRNLASTQHLAPYPSLWLAS
jgi:hypothetical protein